MHSLSDILCQIINVVLLGAKFHEVSAAEVLQELKSRSISKVETAFENFQKSDEFKYVAAFVNTIKHRRLLDTDYHAELGLGTANNMGLRFHAFTYDKPPKPIENYPAVLASTIIDDYIPRIRDYIDSLGAAIEESI